MPTMNAAASKQPRPIKIGLLVVSLAFRFEDDLGFFSESVFVGDILGVVIVCVAAAAGCVEFFYFLLKTKISKTKTKEHLSLSF